MEQFVRNQVKDKSLLSQEDSSPELQKEYQHVPEKEEETLSPEELIKK